MAQPLTDAINALTTYANTVTGASDTDLSSAVATLASGYGGGGDLNALINGTITSLESNESDIRIGVCDGCSNLISVSFPNATVEKARWFMGCGSLQSVNLPSVVSFAGADAYDGCSVTSLIYPSATSSPSGNHFRNSNLITLVFPKLASTGTNAINGATKLTTVDFGETYATMGDYTFNGSTSVNLLIMRKNDGCVRLSNVRALSSTKFKNGGTGGTIYIPKALYDHLGDGTSLDYKSASNWSTLNGYGTVTWMKIEGSQYENYYADGTPIE